MQNPFTTFASSRFINQAMVIDALHEFARELKAQQPEIVAVHLFGSFATHQATPRSDADVIVEIDAAYSGLRETIRETALRLAADLPVPLDAFVLTSTQLQDGIQAGRGVAGAAARASLRLV